MATFNVRQATNVVSGNMNIDTQNIDMKVDKSKHHQSSVRNYNAPIANYAENVNGSMIANMGPPPTQTDETKPSSQWSTKDILEWARKINLNSESIKQLDEYGLAGSTLCGDKEALKGQLKEAGLKLGQINVILKALD